VRIVLNTRSESAGAQASILGLHRRLRDAGVDATLNDWGHYERYDVALFLGYDHDLEAARSSNPTIRIGLADPKQSRRDWIEAARAADFLLVSSVEQREALLRVNRNIHVLFMFPVVPARERVHVDAERVVLGYHGNRVHLESMAGGARRAIEELGRTRPVELVCIYNIEASGRAERGIPDAPGVHVRHVQLDPAPATGSTAPATVLDALADVDIGLVPNLLPVRRRNLALRVTASGDPWLLYEPFDYLLRFKASSNPGRLYPFARLGIPVVADVTPSLSQFVLDGVSGHLVATAEGWFHALDRLASSAALRSSMAAALRGRLDEAYERQVPDLLAFLEGGRHDVPLTLSTGGPERDLARLGAYASPARPTKLSRLRARLRHRLRR
jgi:hypothetical protein